MPSRKTDVLAPEHDDRQEPDSGRQGAFKRGWKCGVASRDNRDDESDFEEGCSYETLAERLTWWNLGFRLGRLFGETSAGLVDEMYQLSAKQYVESKGKWQG